MTIEHRCGARHPINVDIIMRYAWGPGPARVRLRDISLSGAFVGTDLVPRINAAVDLIFPLRRRGYTEIVRYPGVVVRQARDGVGLAFPDLSPGQLATLVEGVASLSARRGAPGSLVAGPEPASTPNRRLETVSGSPRADTAAPALTSDRVPAISRLVFQGADADETKSRGDR